MINAGRFLNSCSLTGFLFYGPSAISLAGLDFALSGILTYDTPIKSIGSLIHLINPAFRKKKGKRRYKLPEIKILLAQDFKERAVSESNSTKQEAVKLIIGYLSKRPRELGTVSRLRRMDGGAGVDGRASRY